MSIASLTTRFPSLRPFLGIFLLNALLAFPLLYWTYKHYSAEQTPMDVPGYMVMAQEGSEAVGAPFRYRLLAPWLVRALDALPGYPVPVDFTADPGAQRVFFHFLALNFLLTVAASGLLFLWLRSRVRDTAAWAGSLLYLFAFFTVTVNLIPMTDAACHAAIMASILCLDRRGPAAFTALAAFGILGALSKEAYFLVMVPWVALSSLPDRRGLWRLTALLPGLAAYAAAVMWMPAGEAGDALGALTPEGYFGAEILASVRNAWDGLRFFDPGAYSRTFLFHSVLSNLPLLAALGGWAWLRWGRGARVPLNRELLIVAALFCLGVLMGINNNAPRLAFMAFPAAALLQARVLEAFWRESGAA